MLHTPNEIQFAADIMIGRLARWLRVLGYDTIYNSNWQTRYLIDRAEKENRILLTRSQRLVEEYSDMKSFLLRQQKPHDQLKTIMAKFKLGTKWIFSRCILCNTNVFCINKEDILQEVPEFVSQKTQRFYRCPNCKKIYWDGSHKKRFSEFLNSLPYTG